MADYKKLILERTNNGADIFMQLYPESAEILNECIHTNATKSNKKIKLRDERTASASFRLTSDKDGNKCWMLKDFGADTDWSCFDAYMNKHNVPYFGQAVRMIAEELCIDTSIKSTVNQPKISYREVSKNEKLGIVLGDRREPTKEELEVMGPAVTAEIMKKYHYQTLLQYVNIKEEEGGKNLKAMIKESTSTYPMFVHDCSYEVKEDGKTIKKEFSKVYMPLEINKGYRFFYVGEKPRDFINGYAEAKEELEYRRKRFEEDYSNKLCRESDYAEYGLTRNRKLPNIVICSGERDSLNLAGLGYIPVWFNSETAKVNSNILDSIYVLTDEIYNIPDKDETGKAQGRKLALEHMRIKTIELPDWLSKFQDARQSPCKDFRDYVDILGKQAAAYDFEKLMSAAQCTQFWEYQAKDGRPRCEIKSMSLLYFLKLHGFYNYRDPITKEIYPIKIDGYTVEKYEPIQIRAFVRQELHRLQVSNAVLEAYINSKKASKQIYEDLEIIDIDFTQSSIQGRTLFFKNTICQISRHGDENKGIKLFGNPKDGRYVWADKIIPFNFKKLAPSFTYDWKEGTLAINLENNASKVLRYIINTCRIYWRKEYEKEIIYNADGTEDKSYREQNKFNLYGSRLSVEEQVEQAQNMLSKIYCIGYLTAQFKIASNAKAIWAMENRITEDGESSGRSGKSLLFQCLKRLHMSEVVTLDGQNKKTTENNHFMDRVSKSTDILLIDDAAKNFDFKSYYAMITGSITVNPKNEKSFELIYEDAPNIAFTSNHPLPNGDSSTLDRILFLSYSDYYHAKGINSNYKESYSVKDDVGNLFGPDYTEDMYNQDINFVIDCLQFYLECLHLNIPPIQPPIGNIAKRQLKDTIMGEEFFQWAKLYFSEESGHINHPVIKQAMYDDYCETIGKRNDPKRPTSFMKAVKAYVQYYDDIFIGIDPQENKYFRRDDKTGTGRLTATTEYKGVYKTYQLIYLQTKKDDGKNEQIVTK